MPRAIGLPPSTTVDLRVYAGALCSSPFTSTNPISYRSTSNYARPCIVLDPFPLVITPRTRVLTANRHVSGWCISFFKNRRNAHVFDFFTRHRPRHIDQQTKNTVFFCDVETKVERYCIIKVGQHVSNRFLINTIRACLRPRRSGATSRR